MTTSNKDLKGRGTFINPHNRFDDLIYSPQVHGEVRTAFVEIEAKSIVSSNSSPDIPFGYSINTYQGCEHGCTYCYARPSHNYWGYSSGLEFESKIVVKRNAVELFEKKLRSTSWHGDTIMLSGNTDCYQPAERQYELTRGIVATALAYQQSLALITKSDLILRDIDLLEEMATKDLVSVALSINTLDDDIRRRLEPRATSIPKRLKTLEELTKVGIPVTVLLAPLIPGINDQEVYDLVEKMADLGARDAHYLIVRLNHDLGILFENWLQHYFPDRAEKVMNKIKALHGGSVEDNTFGQRMRGIGEEAEQINQLYSIAKRKFFPKVIPFTHNTSLFVKNRNGQMSLF